MVTTLVAKGDQMSQDSVAENPVSHNPTTCQKGDKKTLTPQGQHEELPQDCDMTKGGILQRWNH